MIGGGLGDIQEVLDAGAWLARDGHRIRLYRADDRPLPPGVDGPFAWPRHRRVGSLRPTAGRALTIAPTWGVAAAPARDEPFGRAGPWAVEAGAIEAAYGTVATIHVSLEEFARTYSSAREDRERYREGGAPGQGAHPREDVDRWRVAFRRHRALDRPNVLHLLATFAPSPAYGREFPEMVQTGPLWPAPMRHGPTPSRSKGAPLIWYASPSTADRLATDVVSGARRADARIPIRIRSPHPLPGATGPDVRVERSPRPVTVWRREFAGARLRIVTGSRTLLEALAVGGPFLYFNGIHRPRGRPARRHRPEKIQALLAIYRRAGVRAEVVRDLDAFSRGHRVAEVVARALTDTPWRRAFPPRRALGRWLPPPAEATLRAVAARWARSEDDAAAVVADVRALGRVSSLRRVPVSDTDDAR